jgi:hypothetical protein
MMIERALRKQTDIRAFIFALEGEQDEAKRISADDILSNEDWRVLSEVNEILTPLYLQTMRTQGWGKATATGDCGKFWSGWNTCLSILRTGRASTMRLWNRVYASDGVRDPTVPCPSRLARFDVDEGYVSQQRSLPSSFAVSGLPEHSQTEYAAFDKPLAL